MSETITITLQIDDLPNSLSLACAETPAEYCGVSTIQIWDNLLNVEVQTDGTLFTLTGNDLKIKLTHALQFGLQEFTIRAYMVDQPDKFYD